MARLPTLFAAAAALLHAATAVADATVLIYHRFGEGEHPSTSVTLAQFDAHLEHLAREGYRVWPLERIVATLQEGKQLPDQVVAITIDDAFESAYTGAFPRLKARGWPFTLFVNTDFVDARTRGYLSWDQLREMQRHGMRVANHGASHARLWLREPGESEARWTERVRADIGKAQTRLQAELGPDVNESPRLFAYPYGEYDAALATLVAQMRYVAFGQHSGAIAALGDGKALPRFAMAERYAGIDEFAQKVGMHAFPIASVAPAEPRVRDEDPPALVVELETDAWRGSISCYYGGARMPVDWLSATRFRTRAPGPLEAGRNRYNCTGRLDGRWYWFSQPFIK